MLWSVISVVVLIIAIPLMVWIIYKIVKTRSLKIEQAIAILGILIAILFSSLRLKQEVILFYYPSQPKLGSEFKEKWSFNHPAKYSGQVYIRLLSTLDNRGKMHQYSIKWGPWCYNSATTLDSSNAVSLVHTKGDDGSSVPIIFQISPAASVFFGQGESPDRDTVDVNADWEKCE